MKIRQINDSQVDEIILEVEEAEKKEKIHSAEQANFGKSVKKNGDKINLILVLILLAVSIIQSVELYNLRNQIAKGQFSTGAPVPAAGAGQGLPSQQGGC